MNTISLLQSILEALTDEDFDPVNVAYQLHQLAEELENGASLDPEELKEAIVGIAEEAY